MSSLASKGTFLGGILLIMGSCIGAGILALPIMTGIAGFFPSLFMFLLMWGFMGVSSLLIIEVHTSFPGRVNLVSMSERSFGLVGKVVSWVLYLLLFYSLLVAYILGSGTLTSTYFSTFFSIFLPEWIGAFFFTLVFGCLAYRGTRCVDYWNRFFVFGKILAYFGMVFLGFKYITPHLLLYKKPSFVFFSLPILIIVFGYHNMIPTLMAYMNQDAKRVRKVVLIGSFLALLIYLFWEIVVLGIVPLEGKWGIIESFKEGRQASDAVTGILGLSWVSSFAEFFAFFALLSSFLAQTLALVHFLADAFKIKSEKHENTVLCCLALLPPFVFALVYPSFFIQALNFAGGICAVALFGVFPPLMVWKNRYLQKNKASYQVVGGKIVLIASISIAFFILLFQVLNMLGLIHV